MKRTVRVTVVTEIETVGTYELDETEYLEWLDGAPDTAQAVRAFIEGDPYEQSTLARICAFGVNRRPYRHIQGVEIPAVSA